MNRRLLVLLASISVVLAACGAEQPPDTTAALTPAPEGILLSYGLAAGQSYDFEVDIDQTFQMTTTGDSAVLGEELPGTMEARITGTGMFTYSVADGPEPGTFSVNLKGDFVNLQVTGTIDGEPIDELPEIAELGPIDVTLLVDEQGNIIPEDANGFDDLLGGFFGLGGLEGLSDYSGMDFGFFGPPMSDGPVSVGDSWTSSFDIPGMGGEVYTTHIRSTVSRTETVDEFETLVIDTVTETPLIEIDMAEMIRGLLDVFLQFGDQFGEVEIEDPEELAEIEEMLASIRFLLRIPASTSTTTTWFDAENGVSRKVEFSGSGSFVVDVAMPDVGSGELMAFGMSMSSTQKLTYRLVSS